MEYLCRAIRSLRSGCELLVSEPDIAIKMVEAANNYHARVDRWKFVKLLSDCFLSLLCCFGVYILNRFFKGGAITDVFDSILLCVVMCVLVSATLSFRYYVDLEERRCKQQFIRESIFTVFRLTSVGLRKRSSVLSALSTETEALVSTLDTVLTVLSPIVAIFAPGCHAWWRFSFSIDRVSRRFSSVSDLVSRIYEFLLFSAQLFYYKTIGFVGKNKKKVIFGSSLVAFVALAASWKKIRDNKRIGDAVPTRVVPRKRQEISDDTSDCPPAHVCNVMAEIPGSAKFKGSGLVSASLVRVKASYIATAFRTGNFLVTAIHCVGLKNKQSTEKGIWVENPEDRRYYWAPLEQSFLNESVGDGVAVCSLPNSEYFVNLKSCSLGVHKDEEPVMTFTCDCGSRIPSWTISTGTSFLFPDTGLCYMLSTVKPGSSGGPIMNTDGSIIAIVYAETNLNGDPINVGIVINDDVRNFLVSGGAVKPSTSESLTDDQSDIESIEINESDPSLPHIIHISSQNIPGPILGKLLKPKNWKNSNGYQRRKGKDKKKEQSPPLQPEQEHPQS